MNPSRLPDVSTLFPWHAWLRDRSLRSWTTFLFVALVAVPPLGYTMLPSSGDEPFWATVTFAAYFAVVWFLVLRAVVRPRAIVGAVLAGVAEVAVLVEGPRAIALERALGSDPEHVVPSIITVGMPEELAKMVPVVVLVLWCRRRGTPLPPREVLFVGAVSGLGFGAAEAIGYVAPGGLMTTSDALTVVWRLLSDPIVHGCWAGVAGYFLGLASYYRALGPWLALAGIGVGVPAILHGINDAVSGGSLWVVVTVVSALLFLAYARVGIAPRSAAPAPAAALPDPVTAPIALGRHHAVR